MGKLIEICSYAGERLGVLSDDEITNCGFLPDSGYCDDCPYFTVEEVP